MNEYQLVAPDIDRLLRYFDHGHLNPSSPSKALVDAMEPLFAALKDLAPLAKNDEAKAIWLQIPRGSIDDYDSYEDLLEYGEVENREEYEARWLEDYPDEVKWYELVIVESHNRDGSLCFRAVALDNKTIISARMDHEDQVPEAYTDEAAVTLCSLLTDAVMVPMKKLRDGFYNEEVSTRLPYWFRTGVIRRNVMWDIFPDWKKDALDGLAPATVAEYKRLLESGANDKNKIGRIHKFTANDFFRACVVGYKACGYDCEGQTPAELYLRYADGRDEGLTGTGHGLNEGPGIDFDDPEAWDQWYFSKRSGGHPWEIIRGGNSTHVDLYVYHDKHDLGWKLRSGQITEAEYSDRIAKAGYYFIVRGKHRAMETVSFYTALCAVGVPVVIEDADEILARFEGSDYVGIVPHHMIPKYCEGMFPNQYGHVIDFMHVYDDDLEKIGYAIEWLPEEPARLVDE